MKGFFKKHPELLILLIVVIAVDGFITWMWLNDLAATEESKKQHQKLVNDAKAINDSQWRVNAQNASLAEDELKKWQESFQELLTKEQEKYQFTIDYKKGVDQPATARRVLKNKIDMLSQELLKEKDKTNDNLSFKTYAYENTLMTMKADDIESVFVILRGLEEIIHNCIQADVTSINQIVRPSDLVFEEDKSLGTKRYTYVLTLSASAESMKKVLNKISQDEKFFYEINSVKIVAQEQISASANDLIPKVNRTAGGNAKSNQPKRGVSFNELEAGIDNLVGGEKKTPETSDEPIIYKDSVSPFSQAVNVVELSIDWIQFVKEKK